LASRASDHRTGNWMLSYKGRQLWPLDLRPEDIDIEEIAHALSNICRFGGHCLRFYSVAQHSVLVATCVRREGGSAHTKTALLHDATEAYLGDMVRPLKVNMPDYTSAETRAWEAVCAAFDLPLDLPPEVELADARVLLAEKRDLVNDSGHPWEFPQCRFPDAVHFPWTRIRPLLPGPAKQLFLATWDSLR